MSSTTTRAQEFVVQLQHVEKLIGENRLSDAALMLNTLSKTAPSDPRLFLLGSLMAEAANNPAGMLKAAQKAVELAPGWSVATLRLAGTYSATGQVQLAVKTAGQAILQATQESSLSTDLLTRAAAIAIKSEQFALALQWAEQATALAPDQPALQHIKAEALAYNGQYEQAIQIYSALLDQDPVNAAILLDRMLAYINTTQPTLAQHDATQLLSLDPDNETYRYYAAMLKGQTPATQPASVITHLFDHSASDFDAHLQGQLQYTLPQDVAQWLLNWYPDKKFDLLDLGCGTGLLGANLGAINGVIVGVDLSSNMITKAAQRGVYAQFNQVNVLDALQHTPKNHYDVIAALDVLIYVGDLSTVIPNAHRILTADGRFIFSCEVAPSDIKTFALQSTQRFVHQQAHVLSLLKKAGFKKPQIEERTLRLEAGQPVQGFVVTAQK